MRPAPRRPPPRLCLSLPAGRRRHCNSSARRDRPSEPASPAQFFLPLRGRIRRDPIRQCQLPGTRARHALVCDWQSPPAASPVPALRAVARWRVPLLQPQPFRRGSDDWWPQASEGRYQHSWMSPMLNYSVPTSCLFCGRSNFVTALAVGLPHFPRGHTAAIQALEMLPVLERVHARPEAIIPVADQLLFFHQPLERLIDKFLFLANVIEDLLFENEEASVDSHRAHADCMDLGHQITVPLLQRNHVVAEVRPDAKETGGLALLMEVFQLLRERQIGKAVTIVGQELLFSVEVLLDCLQPLADVGIDSRICKGNLPVLDVAVKQFQLFPTAG